jgi:hypothetical protein
VGSWPWRSMSVSRASDVERTAIRPLEFGQVPAQPVGTADHASPARPDNEESFLLLGVQGDAGRLSADAVLSCYFWLGCHECAWSESALQDLSSQIAGLLAHRPRVVRSSLCRRVSPWPA